MSSAYGRTGTGPLRPAEGEDGDTLAAVEGRVEFGGWMVGWVVDVVTLGDERMERTGGLLCPVQRLSGLVEFCRVRSREALDGNKGPFTVMMRCSCALEEVEQWPNGSS